MGHVKTGAYSVSEEKGFLTDFNSIQSFLEDERNLEQFDVENLKKLDFDPIHFSEEASLAYLIGYLLLHTILSKKSKCEECKKAFVISIENDDQKVNSIIKAREYKAGA